MVCVLHQSSSPDSRCLLLTDVHVFSQVVAIDNQHYESRPLKIYITVRREIETTTSGMLDESPLC